MKKILIVLTLIILTAPLFAQDNKVTINPNKFGAEINAGPSIPYGDFGSKDPYNESAGFAKLGYKIEANVSYHLIDVIDVYLMGFYNSNGTKLSALEDALKQKYGGTWTAGSRTWNTYGGFIGFEFSYPIYKKVSMGFRAYSGLLNSTAPELTVSRGSDFYRQDEKTATSFSYIISINGKYHLARNFFWVLSLDFLGSNASFKDVNITEYVGGYTTVRTGTFSQDMRTFIISTGPRITF
ncbi:MAG TPA: hypothetical protein VN514_01035 [Ignavibacteria bacterium]|nr:hypothetical protein [Ignavibacteria bacterium]